MYMRFRMQIESVMKEVTFWAEPRALKSRAGPRGAGSVSKREGPSGAGLGLRVGRGAGVGGVRELGVCRGGITDCPALGGEEVQESVGPVLSLYRCGN